MKKTFKIGQKEYKFKKDAIMHYRTILNSYDFGQSLKEEDFIDLLDLLNYDYFNYLVELEMSEENSDEKVKGEFLVDESNEIEEGELSVEDIKIAKVQFNTKCFEVFFSDNTSEYISYLMIINKTKYTPEKLFTIACRNSIHDDIRAVKLSFFDKNSIKGQVKCQETGILSKWTELVVDHRQPNTFSIIIDRFKEVHKVDLDAIEYTSDGNNHIVFQDNSWSDTFKKYHREKANLRIVRIECNSSRTGMARVKRTAKDLTFEG